MQINEQVPLFLMKVICWIFMIKPVTNTSFLLRLQNTSLQHNIQVMSPELLQERYNISILNSYHIGDSVSFLIEDRNLNDTLLRQHFKYTMDIEPDAIVEKFGRDYPECSSQYYPEFSNMDYPECTSQYVGGHLWGLGRISKRGSNGHNEYMYYTYNNSEKLDDVHVYIMDTGIYTEHHDFGGRASWLYTASGISGEGNEDLNGHGTHVAGIVGGTTHGVAKTVQIHAIKVLDKEGIGTISGILESIEFVTNKFLDEYARVGERPKYIINLSLGMQGSSEILQSAVQASTDQGIVYVVAAGNDNQDACDWTPAGIKEVITVGAVDKHDTMASFSNYGPCVDILAPGIDINSAWIGEPGATLAIQGTSAAAPHVAGVVARLMSTQHYSDVTCYSSLLKHLANQGKANWILYMGCESDPYGGQCLEEPVWQGTDRVYKIVGAVVGCIVVVICVGVCILVGVKVKQNKRVTSAGDHTGIHVET